MKKTVALILCLFGLLLVSAPVFAQRTVSGQGDMSRSIPERPGWVRNQGNSVIIYDNIRVFSNFGEFNSATQEFEAWGNLRIRVPSGIITGVRLRNYPQLNMMVVYQDVIFTDRDGTQLFTDRLAYDRRTEISTYTTGGRIIMTDSTILTSQIGHFHSRTNEFHGRTDVVIEHPDYLIHTDSVQMRGDVIYFFGPTHVWSDDNYLFAERGWKNTEKQIASLSQNAFIQTPEQRIYADSIYYEMEIDFGMAFNNVIAIDSANDIIIHSDFALTDRRIGEAWFTENPVAIFIDNGDSLFLRGDTLRILYDTVTDDIIHMLAYHNVRFFRHDMQGVGDSLAYVVADSTLTLFGDPIVWSNDDQMTSDTIRILLADNRPQHMYLLNQAFIVSRGYHEGIFNQIRGREAIGFFNDSSDLESIQVFENVETVYFIMDDSDNSLIGILKQPAEEMKMRIENQVVISINYLRPGSGSMFPYDELPAEERFLQGFSWQIERRPKSRDDIFPQRDDVLMQRQDAFLQVEL
ncbi:MAG: hypothetical protein FWC94_06380 [Bacteroidales bacterium]|nr:hypothetical protein [Bacteroidales bacterium]